jgi:hypothetical protein
LAGAFLGAAADMPFHRNVPRAHYRQVKVWAPGPAGRRAGWEISVSGAGREISVLGAGWEIPVPAPGREIASESAR